MKKLGLIFKENSKNRIKKGLEESNGVFIVSYAKLSAGNLNTLRKSLRVSKASLFVVKNSVARSALKEAKLETLLGHIQDPCGFVFVQDEPVAASKVLCDFSKNNEALKIRGALIERRTLDEKGILDIARLPNKETLRLQVLMALKSPICGLVFVLSGTLKKFVYCLEQIKEKKPKEET